MSGHVVICGTRPAKLGWAATCQYLWMGAGDAILILKRSVGKLDPPKPTVLLTYRVTRHPLALYSQQLTRAVRDE